MRAFATILTTVIYILANIDYQMSSEPKCTGFVGNTTTGTIEYCEDNTCQHDGANLKTNYDY